MPNGSKANSPVTEEGRSVHRSPDIVRQLTEQFRTLEAAAPVALAVSGGGDSVALAHLVAEVAPELDIPLSQIVTVTVDHGLRKESAAEAETVGRWMQGLGLAHEVLTVKGGHTGPGMQAAARRTRYGLMLHWCVRHGVRTLITAHTADDQAETILMRLARGSGVDGLSGIAPVRVLEAVDGTHVRLLRPLLGVPRAALRDWLEERGIAWLEDPSNENPAFDRVKARHALRLLGPLGLSRARLVKTAQQLARARAALEVAADTVETVATEFHPAGFVMLDPAALAGASREVALRVFARLLMRVSGAAYRPRLDRLVRALDVLSAAGGPGRARTLGGCRLIPQRDGRVLVCRELRSAAAAVPLAPGGTIVWDGRFRVHLATGIEAGEVGAAGGAGLRQLRARPGFDAGDIPPPARSALPCFFRHGEAIAAPHLNVDLPGLCMESLGVADRSLMRFFEPPSRPRA